MAVIPAVACQLLFVAVLLLTFESQVTSEVWGLAILSGLLFVQVITYVAIGLGVSLTSLDSGSALVRAVGFWVAMAVVIPGTVDHLMHLWYPSAEQTDLQLKRSEMARRHYEEAFEIYERHQIEARSTLYNHPMDGSYLHANVRYVSGTRASVEMTRNVLQALGPLVIARAEGIREVEEEFEWHLENWWKKKEMIGSLSPTVAARTATLAVCGVDVWSVSRWMRIARKEHETLTRALAGRFADLDYFCGIGRGVEVLDDGLTAGMIGKWEDVASLRPSYTLFHEPFAESVSERLGEESTRIIAMPIVQMLLWILWMLFRARKLQVE